MLRLFFLGLCDDERGGGDVLCGRGQDVGGAGQRGVALLGARGAVVRRAAADVGAGADAARRLVYTAGRASAAVAIRLAAAIAVAVAGVGFSV